MASKEQLALQEIVPENTSHCAAKSQEIFAEEFNDFVYFCFTQSCTEIKNLTQKNIYLFAPICYWLLLLDCPSVYVFISVLERSDSLIV